MIYVVIVIYGIALLYLLRQDKMASALICKLVDDQIKMNVQVKALLKENRNEH